MTLSNSELQRATLVQQYLLATAELRRFNEFELTDYKFMCGFLVFFGFFWLKLWPTFEIGNWFLGFFGFFWFFLVFFGIFWFFLAFDFMVGMSSQKKQFKKTKKYQKKQNKTKKNQKKPKKTKKTSRYTKIGKLAWFFWFFFGFFLVFFGFFEVSTPQHACNYKDYK